MLGDCVRLLSSDIGGVVFLSMSPRQELLHLKMEHRDTAAQESGLVPPVSSCIKPPRMETRDSQDARRIQEVRAEHRFASMG